MSTKEQSSKSDTSGGSRRVSPQEAQHVERATYQAAPALAAQHARFTPWLGTPHDLLHLQRTIGNRAVRKLLMLNGQQPSIVQRTVVQSDWLKIEKEPRKISMAQTSTGPWTEIKDKTNEGYRSAAEAILGDRDILFQLARLNIIRARPVGARNPFTRSHLIAAQFGGQKKFAPQANIRYHPETLEYGEWQASETKVEDTGEQGYITVRSTEASDTTGALLAIQIVDIIRDAISGGDASRIEAALGEKLACARYIPVSVGFDYTDTVNPSRSFANTWSNQDAELELEAIVSKEQVYKLLQAVAIPLPGGLDLMAIEQSIPKYTISERAHLVNLIKGFSSDKKRKNTIIASLNKQFTIPQIDQKKFIESLEKLPEIAGKDMKIEVIADFHQFAPLTIAEVMEKA